RALEKVLPMQRGDFVEILREMKGLPVTIRLLDPPLHEFLPQEKAELAELAKSLGRPIAALEQKLRELHETNPMLGHRGCRLAITFPEIYAMQARAIGEAALELSREKIDCRPEIMIPIVGSERELAILRDLVSRTLREVAGLEGAIPIGTMIELPRACLV